MGAWQRKCARILAGKNNPKYTPFIDTGDHVVVINCEKIKLTGLKSEAKVYQHYTGFPGGLREEEFVKRLAQEAGVDRSVGHPGHAAQDEDGPRDGLEAEGL